MPGLVANEIVSVQPMSLPVGDLFHLDYQYGKKELVIHQLELPLG